MRCQRGRQLQSQRKQISIIKPMPDTRNPSPADNLLHHSAQFEGAVLWRKHKKAAEKREHRRERNVNATMTELSVSSSNCASFYIIANTWALAALNAHKGDAQVEPEHSATHTHPAHTHSQYLKPRTPGQILASLILFFTFAKNQISSCNCKTAEEDDKRIIICANK